MKDSHTATKFSLLWFIIQNFLITLIFMGALKLLAPTLWNMELGAPVLLFVLVFLVMHMVNAFIEFFFHRYVFHTPAIPFLKMFYVAHTRHHSHTEVTAHNGTVSNKYPILTDKQHESSFLPWYTLLIANLLLTPCFAVIALFFPHLPIFIAGYIAVLWSLVLYELFHVAFHWPLTRWEPLFKQKIMGTYWKRIYSFHLRHHANNASNEAVSGFFGIPIADMLFRTHVTSKTLYPHCATVDSKEFKSPRPIFFIHWLDKKAYKNIHH